MRKRKPSERKTFDVPEVAQQLGTNKDRVYREVKEGRLPHLRFGKRIVIPASALERYLATCGGAYEEELLD